MKTTLGVVAMIVFLWASVCLAEGDNLKSDKGALNVIVQSVEFPEQLYVYAGDGTAIEAPTGPPNGMSTIIMIADEDDGSMHTYLLQTVRIQEGTKLKIAVVKCEIENTTDLDQNFVLGDISLKYSIGSTEETDNDFAAVGTGEYLFRKSGSALEAVKKKSYKLVPGEKMFVQYLFGVPLESVSIMPVLIKKD